MRDGERRRWQEPRAVLPRQSSANLRARHPHRVVQFVTIEGDPVDADERYFRVRAVAPDIACDGHTALERRVMQQWRWFTAADIAAHHEAIFPEDLIDLLALPEPLP